MAAICDFKQLDLPTWTAVNAAASSAASAGITWLLSDITHPLVGGAVAGIGALATIVTCLALQAFKCSDDVKGFVIPTASVIAPVVFAMAATALGFSVSIPLSVLFGVANLFILLKMDE
jgi:hypothetical protein